MGQPAEQSPSIDPHHHIPGSSPCYDDMNIPQRCVPDFINAAFNLQVEVTNTCGLNGPISYCVQTGHSGVRKVCDICDSRVEAYAHPPAYLTDFNNANNETWWQSETMNEGMQYPNSINLTLRLGKTFDITYVRLKFISPRPESFYNFSSGSCRSTYGLPEKAPILPSNEAVAQCTREFSDISPLTGGNIAFSTLEGRPSSQNFEESETLQDWVTASEIRIMLTRMNTFGDEVFRDAKVLRSYYYAISDFAVGGRCKCNGHASECVKSTGDGEDRLVCRCEHNTMGADCDQCLPFYNDRPWRVGTAKEANECIGEILDCYCNDNNSCDDRMNDETCGAHCEECAPFNWRRPGEHYCVPCQCNEIGSLSMQCDEYGQCPCKAGIGGQFCDHCISGYYDFSISGCKNCLCDKAGSLNNEPMCDSETGSCSCKSNVEGQQCNKCKPGYFDLSLDNQFGCTPCFCYGHSSICSSASGFYAMNVSSNFDDGKQQWIAGSLRGLENIQWAEMDKAIAVSDIDGSPVYFVAPAQFIGDQRASYNQDLWFTLRVQKPQRYNNCWPRRSRINDTNFAQENPMPTINEQTYRFRIHADPIFQWSPRLNELDFIGILSNISAIKIRGTYSAGDVGFLSNIHLGSAGLITPTDESHEAHWIELCNCLEGFIGQFCESCAPGYRREIKFGGPFDRCVKCECHGHSTSCEPESGECICEHNTAGDTCERCARGFYGNALQGTSDDCVKCPCPEDGPCVLHTDGDIICTDCPTGYTGRRCDVCADGFFGNPSEGKACVECLCSGNIDPNSIGNCDSLTGECKKCIYDTIGFNCEECKPGYWGDALLEPKGDCKACNCFAPGTKRPNVNHVTLECRQSDGQCNCQPHVLGLHCDHCQPGYFNLTSGSGCQECNCDSLGSVNSTCDVLTGQCLCKPGVMGRRCDQCEPQYYGFGINGCEPCDCEVIGSESPQCDVITGQCLCRDHIEGRRCDHCIENRYNLHAGCLPCDDCYTLIQRRVHEFRKDIGGLEETLKEIIENPAPVDDAEFDNYVKTVSAEVEDLADTINKKLGERFEKALELLNSVDDIINEADKKAAVIEETMNHWRLIKVLMLREEDQDKIFLDQKGKVRLLSVLSNNSSKLKSTDRARSDLENALYYLETEGRTQWELAQEASRKYGEQSQQLSEIAQEARKLAEQQENRSIEIEALAEKIANSSKQALIEAKEVIFGGDATSKEIAILMERLNATEILLNQTRKLAEEQLMEADRAYKTAAESLTAVESLRLPNIDPQQIEEEAKRVADDAQATADNAKEQAIANKELIDEAARIIAEAKYELQRVQDQQKVSDELLADVDAAKSRAMEAVLLAENTLAEAQHTLEILNDFEERVDASKSEAIEELKNLKEIEKEIALAENTTREAEDAIGNAKMTRSWLKKSLYKLKRKLKEAYELRNQTQDVRKTAEQLKSSADQLVNDVKETGTTMEDYRRQASSDKARASELAEKAAEGANKTISEAQDSLRNIINQLNSLDGVNSEELDELEKQLNQAEELLNGADLDKQVSLLKEQKIEQDRTITQFKNEIDTLKDEVQNLEEIRDSLPNKCFNVINLEQEGHK
ncbi:Laminin-like protein lam-2 [Dirofilaria immitis]|nr:Laminin-like protein lam-2 [Dirofilaria immitis]